MIYKGNKQAIASFFCGLVGILTLVPVFGTFAMLFSLLSFKNKTERKRFAWIAMALGIIQLLVNAARYASGV